MKPGAWVTARTKNENCKPRFNGHRCQSAALKWGLPFTDLIKTVADRSVAEVVCRGAKARHREMFDLKLVERYAGEQKPPSFHLLMCTLYDAGFAYGRLLLWRADGLR